MLSSAIITGNSNNLSPKRLQRGSISGNFRLSSKQSLRVIDRTKWGSFGALYLDRRTYKYSSNAARRAATAADQLINFRLSSARSAWVLRPNEVRECYGLY